MLAAASSKIANYRAHLVREHCNMDGGDASAYVLVTFDYRSPMFVLIGRAWGSVAVGATRTQRAGRGIGRWRFGAGQASRLPNSLGRT